jgi:hypothetical protein
MINNTYMSFGFYISFKCIGNKEKIYGMFYDDKNPVESNKNINGHKIRSR